MIDLSPEFKKALAALVYAARKVQTFEGITLKIEATLKLGDDEPTTFEVPV